jgi:hypothetical protein
MPTVAPTKTLTSVIIREFFPATAASATAPAFAATYLGPIRTVVPAEKGLLGGYLQSELAPIAFNERPRISIVVEFKPGINTIVAPSSATFEFGRVEVTIPADGYDGVSEMALGVVDYIKTDAFTASLIDGYRVESFDTPIAGATESNKVMITLFYSKSAVDRGLCPGLKVTGIVTNGPVNGSVLLFDSKGNSLISGDIIQPTIPDSTNVDYPELNTNWNEIITREISHQVLFDMDTEWERFHFDIPSAGKDAIGTELAKTFPEYAFRGDFIYATSTADFINLTISKDPIPGTQRVSMFDLSTGVEYQLRHVSDKEATNLAAPGSTEYDYSTDLVSDDGAYEKGTVITFNTTSTLLATGHFPMILRAVYIPKRFSTPRPAYNFRALVPGSEDVITGLGVGDFTVDTTSGGSINVPVKIAPPDASNITYTKSSQVPEIALPLQKTDDYAYENWGSMVASVNFSFSPDGGDPAAAVTVPMMDFTFKDLEDNTIDLPSFDLNTSNILSALIVKNSDSPVATLTAGVDYDLNLTNNSITFNNTVDTVGLGPYTVEIGEVVVPFADVNLAPTLTKEFLYDASNQGGQTIQLNTPGISWIEVKMADSSVAAGGGTDYSIDTDTGALTIVATPTGVLSLPVNNPVSIKVRYSPHVDFVGNYDTDWNLLGSSSRPSYWVGTFPPVPQHLGGGRFRVYVSGIKGSGAASEIYAIGTLGISATIKYPVSPEIQLEFMADRNDLDGSLYTFPSSDSIQAEAALSDAYAGQTIEVDLTPANPTLHAAVIGLTASPGVPVMVGVGDMTPTRSSKILQRLEREFNPYHIVAISQDEDSVLGIVGAHIDKVVDTFAGTQVHLNAGKLRVMYTTLDQRNEDQVLPLTNDTSSGKARIMSKAMGGITILTDLADADDIEPGYYIELHQVDATSSTSVLNTGLEVAYRQKSRRYRISAIDTSNGDVRLDVVDSSLPGTLSYSNYPIVRPSAYRIVRQRDDYQLATEIQTKVAAIGALGANRGRRRWIRQPDMLTLNDGGTSVILPGYYRSVIEAAIRANTLPHQGMSRYPLPLIESVARGLGYYVSDDVINIMTDGGADYAIQDYPSSPVFSLQQLTADRTNQYTQAPTVTQIVDFVAYALYNAMKVYLGVTNVADETLDMFAATAQATLDRMRNIKASGLGPMIQRGRIVKLEPLPSTATNSGIYIQFAIVPALATEEIQMDIFVDTDSNAV